LAGKHALYRLCEQYGISYRRLGKIVVATTESEINYLETLLRKGKSNGVEELNILSKREMNNLEPNVVGVAALLSQSTGIIDVYELMKFFLAQAIKGGIQIVYKARVVRIEKISDKFKVTIRDDNEQYHLLTRVLINCAGLYSDQIAELSGIDIVKAGYKLHYCRGEYFTVNRNKASLVSRLVFPVPPANGTGVGIHTTLDMEGRMRLGPSIYYVNDLDYAMDNQHQGFFYDSIREFLPFIEYDDLSPDSVGIRPKLQGPSEDMKDFIISNETDKGLPGLINLIGIESPGLTAAPAIGEYVLSLIREYLAIQ